MKNPLKTFEPNTKGRDFVIGDLHGSLPCLEKLMEGLYFDKSVDRMFSVGDLVDRGPKSLDCLRLLREPWFHAVLANHEQMMLEAFTGGYIGMFWVKNGGAWGRDALALVEELKVLDEDEEYTGVHGTNEAYELIDLLKEVEELPFLITVNMPDGRKFHVIHAELPPGHCGLTDNDLSSPGRLMEIATTQVRDGDAFLWSRFLFANFYRSDLQNEAKVQRTVAYKYRHSNGPFNDKLSHIISGHTIVQRPLTILGQTNIDTCAFDACDDDAGRFDALSCVELGTWKFYQATPSEFRTVEPLVVSSETIAALRRPEFEAIDKANHMSIGGTPIPTVNIMNPHPLAGDQQ